MCREIVIFETFVPWRPFAQHASHIFSYSNCRCRWSCLKVHPEWPRVTTRDHESPRVTTSHHESPRMTTSEKAKNIRVNFMGNAKGTRTMGLTDIPQRKLLCGTDDYRLKWIKLIPWHFIYGECIIYLFVSHVTGEDGVLERQVIVKGKPNLVLLV